MRALTCLLLLATCLSATWALDIYAAQPIDKITETAAPAPSWQQGKMLLDCAGNEGEAGQIVLRSAEALADVSVQLADLQGPAQAVIPVSQMRLYQVQWVDINAPFEVDQPSTNPDFRPDPLPPVDVARDRFSLEPGRNLVLWLNVTAPPQARPGLYRGQVKFLAGGKLVGTLALQLRVRAFALPQQPLLQSMVGLSAGNIYRAHGCKTPEEQEQIIRLYFDEYIRARLSPFLYAPGTMAFNPLPEGCIAWEFAKDAEGKPTGEAGLDFTGFDREGERYFNQRRAFSAFNFAPYLWTRRETEGKKQMVLVVRDTKGTAIERLNPDGSVNPLFDRLVIAVFRGIAAHLADKGWLDRAIYYVTDEPGEEDTPAIKQICELIRQADPRLRTSLTYDPANRPKLAELVDAQGQSLISVWIPYCTLYREEVAAEQRQKGADYWLYDVSSTCLIGHSGLVNRAIMWDVWRHDTHGYLYYLSTYWGRDATPWERPSFLLPGVSYRYRQGDGYFFYPPQRHGVPEQPILQVVPTIRWEMLREGAEDYEYLRLVEGLTQQAEDRKLPQAAQGRKALAQAHRLADSISGAFTGYSIRDLQFEAIEGWSCGREEGWLRHGGGQRSDLPITVGTKLPDGRYDLLLNVYEDSDYRGIPFSRFLVDGRPYQTATGNTKGPTTVPAGTVEVKGGQATFTLSALDDKFGVILYGVSLRLATAGRAADLYQVRAQLADAIEALQQAQGR
jgi:hypothetical protein